jgi:hypothetical protein
MTNTSSNSTFTMLDYSDVHASIIKIILFDVIGFSGYAILLYTYCVLWEGLVCTILLFSTQLIIGMIVTRSHHSLGITIKNKVQFINPSMLDLDWNQQRVDLEFGELKTRLSNIFSTIPVLNSNEIDDYNDVAWFVILLWSLISSVVFSFFNLDPSFCVIGALVTALTCLMTFMNGYKSTDLEYLRNDLEHIEFFILSRLSKLNEIRSNSHRTSFIEWVSKHDTTTLNDVGFAIRVSRGNDKFCIIDYYLGISSLKNERIEIQIMNNDSSLIISKMKKLASKSNWSFESQPKENYTWIKLYTKLEEGSLQLHNMLTINLDSIEKASTKVYEFLSQIIAICSKQ